MAITRISAGHFHPWRSAHWRSTRVASPNPTRVENDPDELAGRKAPGASPVVRPRVVRGVEVSPEDVLLV